MVVQTVTFGSGQYSSYTAYGSGYDLVSNWTINGSVTVAEAPLTGAIGSYSMGSRPVNLRTLRLYWWADANPTTSTVDFQISTGASGSGGWQSGATNANGSSTNITANYVLDRVNVRYYGLQKNDTGNVRFYSYASTGNDIYGNGSVAWADRRQYGQIVIDSLPSAPGTPTATFANSSAVTLAWTAPSDEGSSGGVNGYRILTRLTSATANANTDWSVAVGDTGSTSLSYTLTGLSSGTSYVFMVAALNSVSDIALSNDGLTYSSLNAHTGTNSGVSAAINTTGGVYNGTSWLASPNIQVYNGTSWQKATVYAHAGITESSWRTFGE